jgi:hypothetical protein
VSVLSPVKFSVQRTDFEFYGMFTVHLQEAIGTEAPGQVDCLYWVSAIQGADEISPA